MSKPIKMRAFWYALKSERSSVVDPTTTKYRRLIAELMGGLTLADYAASLGKRRSTKRRNRWLHASAAKGHINAKRKLSNGISL
jgi:hypothetical protein